MLRPDEKEIKDFINRVSCKETGGFNHRYVCFKAYGKVDIDEFERAMYECFPRTTYYLPNELCFYVEKAAQLSDVYNFSRRLPDAIVLATETWDYHGFEIAKNGEAFNDYTLKFINNTPRISDPDLEEECYDCDLELHFSVDSGDCYTDVYEVVGGGMCTVEDMEDFKNLVTAHPASEEIEL